MLLCGGYKIIKRDNKPDPLDINDDEKINIMAEMEHGRWNIERLLEGFKYGPQKDTLKKINPSLVSWKQLPDEIKKYDRDFVRETPRILAEFCYEVVENDDE